MSKQRLSKGYATAAMSSLPQSFKSITALHTILSSSSSSSSTPCSLPWGAKLKLSAHKNDNWTHQLGILYWHEDYLWDFLESMINVKLGSAWILQPRKLFQNSITMPSVSQFATKNKNKNSLLKSALHSGQNYGLQPPKITTFKREFFKSILWIS